jgi:hypothetical protein
VRLFCTPRYSLSYIFFLAIRAATPPKEREGCFDLWSINTNAGFDEAAALKLPLHEIDDRPPAGDHRRPTNSRIIGGGITDRFRADYKQPLAATSAWSSKAAHPRVSACVLYALGIWSHCEAFEFCACLTST